MIGHHLSISALWKTRRILQTSAGRALAFLDPSRRTSVARLGRPMNQWTASFSFAMMFFGVPLGAHRPAQTET